ncbi:MAG: hypothetical protein EP330_20225 [Deltaproteobacteria bacterium]|nr:MAG: hypothetical protein EP330_20225 [Deltaproteobacteria bacterium]
MLVYDARSDAGVWRADLGENVLFVRFGAKHLLVAGSKGTLRAYERKGGKAVWTASLGKSPKDLATYGEQGWAAVIAKGVQLGEGSTLGAVIEVPKPTCVACFGKRVAVGSKDGHVRLFEDASLVDGTDLERPVTGLCANEDGLWFATGGDRVFALDPLLASGRAVAGENDSVLAFPVVRGPLVAFRMDKEWVGLSTWADRQPMGAVQYQEEPVGEIALGEGGRVLAIGIGHGDANFVDLVGGGIRRTDPHDGRPRHRWTLAVGVEGDEIAEALANPPAPEGMPTTTTPGEEEDDDEISDAAAYAIMAVLALALMGLGGCVVACLMGALQA